MKIALAVTVKNERQLLRPNLLYHHYLGVDAVFVFSDATTDDTLESLGELPFVRVCPSVPPGGAADRPGFETLVKKASLHHTARQCLNAAFAMAAAKQEGFDWMVSLDADELICLDFHTAEKGGLADYLGSVDKEIAQVRFQTLEVVQHRLEYENVFARETLFKRNSPDIRRRIYDPFKKKTWTKRGFYGHNQGKSAVRLTARAIPRTVHSFMGADGRELNTLKEKFLLHYYCYCFSDFIKKFENFKNRPDTFLGGQAVAYVPKLLWRDLVNGSVFSEGALENYYGKYVLFTKREIRRLRKSRRFGLFQKQPAVLEIGSVKEAFARIYVAASGEV
jgi:hypothetical protein